MRALSARSISMLLFLPETIQVSSVSGQTTTLAVHTASIPVGGYAMGRLLSLRPALVVAVRDR